MKTTRLAAIMFVDIADFKDLQAHDERASIDIITGYRAAAIPIIEANQGKIFDLTGDEILAIFESALSAAQCAIHIQLEANARKAKNAMGVRIGMHLGEVWMDETRVYGNGVNVASRIRDLAGPGELLVSDDFLRQVDNKMDIASRLVPNKGLKNIERQLEVYRILTGHEEAPAIIQAAIEDNLNLDIDVDDDSTDEESTISVRPRLSQTPERRINQAIHNLGKGLKTMLAGAAIGAGFLYWNSLSASMWLLAGAVLFGAIPLMSGINSLARNSYELRCARKDTKKKIA